MGGFFLLLLFDFTHIPPVRKFHCRISLVPSLSLSLFFAVRKKFLPREPRSFQTLFSTLQLMGTFE